MKYSELNLSYNKDTKTIDMGDGKEIKVLQYLPVDKKHELIQLVLQESEENGIYSRIKLDCLLQVFMVYFYTDLEFTDEERATTNETFDSLFTSGLLHKIIEAIPGPEVKDLWSYLDQEVETSLKYRTTAAYMLTDFINAIPEKIEKVAQIVENFDPQQYQNVLDFAKAANGGRDIVTNE